MVWLNEQKDSDLFSVRPLVRYVDEDQAVIELHFLLLPEVDQQAAALDAPLNVRARLTDEQGASFEHEAEMALDHRSGMVRFELTQPQRWWPMGMGDQALYDMSVAVSAGPDMLETLDTTIGLTSVRPAAGESMVQTALLVNGQPRAIRQVVTVEPLDELRLLPAGSDSLLVVRHHFGPDVLFAAADRAGMLLVQSLPAGGERMPIDRMLTQVDRLATHPSLVGWLIEQTDKPADRLVRRVQRLDPTRSIFRHLPLAS